ncbi:hypothetical protein AMATHDRAFT_142067 [Amanita thiersii Skay4041]|uniref:Uncharacterized protein n=1 Tax=Amanita thiersii Skay4041 TaxID=703135 RepID=A0A2A9NVA0_9AGAR|nr:hypothetical protein AMATHDRAFT_142067 [Amanita thiersii Skay4041]
MSTLASITPEDATASNESLLPDPHCTAMEELPSATTERAKVRELLLVYKGIVGREVEKLALEAPLYRHLSYGLAYTTGSALGSVPPSGNVCLRAFSEGNRVGLIAGARAWSKHFHRSSGVLDMEKKNGKRKKAEIEVSAGWWGIASGSVGEMNEKALALFWRVVGRATWRNLHWLPHQVLVYEVRVEEGYGMRWSQDWGASRTGETGGIEGTGEQLSPPWTFRGFVEPMMEHGHEVGWRH